MKLSQLTKYQKSRMSNCIYCGKPITENQEFQYASTKVGRYVAYAFIHNDCIVNAQNFVRKVKCSSTYGTSITDPKEEFKEEVY